MAANNLLRPEVGDKVPDPDPSQSAGRCRPQLGDDESGRLIAGLDGLSNLGTRIGHAHSQSGYPDILAARQCRIGNRVRKSADLHSKRLLRTGAQQSSM